MTQLRVAISGSGNRSRTAWQRHLRQTDSFILVGVQDINPKELDRAQAMELISSQERYGDLDDLLRKTQPDVLIVCNTNDAHGATVEAGLRANCHVLVEKPFVTNLSDGARLAQLAERSHRVLGVVQNWRVKSVGQALRKAIAEEAIGQVSHIFFRYLRNRELSHLPGYLFEEPDPLLFSMSIHHFDLFRYILGQEIIQVEGHAFRPIWSRYRYPSSMQLWMETEAGVGISYVATLSSRNGHLPLESLQVEGELGTLFNESEYSEPPLHLSRSGDEKPVDLTSEVRIRDRNGQYDLSDLALLRNFYAAITQAEPLISPAWDNLRTLAVLEAARLCTSQKRPINPQELLSQAPISRLEPARKGS